MADFEFKDNSAAVKGALKEAAVAFLNEVGGEVASRTKQNSRRKTGKTAGSWTYQVDDSGFKVTIGSGEENALWEELGTGEYAVNGDGRNGYWVFVEGQSKGGGGGKTLDLASAKRAMAMLRRKGLNAYYTKGKRPNKALQQAGNSVAPLAQAAAEKTFGRIG